MDRTRCLPLSVLLGSALLCASSGASAENVDPASNGSQYAWGEHIGWLNAEPHGEGGPGIHVSDTELTGWIWAGDRGWISLSCQNTSSCDANAYGVSNDGKGNLAGSAWGEHLGWISFRAGGGHDCCSANGTPGCNDSACEAAICPEIPSCCSGAWDSACAGAALDEPSCSPGCAAASWGVRIHGFTGRFSGVAWSEHDGWIHFGEAAPVGAHQIETAWRCPDLDADGICAASDNCSTLANPGQGKVAFAQTVRASPNKTDLVWPTAVDWQLARGTFAASLDVGSYNADLLEQGSGTAFSDTAPGPGAGHGYWYLVRPNCPAGSFSTDSPFELGDRDDALIP